MTRALLRGLQRSVGAAQRGAAPAAKPLQSCCKARPRTTASAWHHPLDSQAWLSGELILRAERRGLEELPAALWRKTTARQLILTGTRCRALRAGQ